MDYESPRLVLMCASCWNIQPLENEFEFDLGRWLDPITYSSRGERGLSDRQIIDGYCDPCLAEMTARDHATRARATRERINA
jgi:hypothetical protein